MALDKRADVAKAAANGAGSASHCGHRVTVSGQKGWHGTYALGYSSHVARPERSSR